MANNLEVNNNIFRYKDTRYQVTHISAVRMMERKIRNKNFGKQNYSVKPALQLFAAAAFFAFISYIAYNVVDNGWVKFGLIAITVVLGMQGMTKFEEYKKEKKKSATEYYMMYALSIMLFGGSLKYFWSSNQETINKIHNALTKAMNRENVSVKLENVNIQITDAENVDIANIGV